MAKEKELPGGFTRRADASKRGFTMDLVRAKLKLPLSGICLSSDLLVREVHYYKRRTVPCNKLPNCEPCQLNYAPRATGYLAVHSEVNGKNYIFEVPEESTWQVDDYWKLFRTLRGHHVKIERIGPRENGRCRVTFGSPRLTNKVLPDCPDVIACLCKMWGMRDWQMMMQIFTAGEVSDPATRLPIERQA